MIPFSVSDIIKLLEQIPIWKQLKAIPQELEQLRRRVDALEAKLASPPAPGKECPACGARTLRVISSERSEAEKP